MLLEKVKKPETHSEEKIEKTSLILTPKNFSKRQDGYESISAQSCFYERFLGIAATTPEGMFSSNAHYSTYLVDLSSRVHDYQY